MMEYNTLDDMNVEGKTVLLRVDFNMPLDKKTFEILDVTRMKRVVPTLHELYDKKAKTVILAHQGRKGSWDFTDLSNHAKTLSSILQKNVTFVDDIHGQKARDAITAMRPGEYLMLDNVRKIPYETDKKSAEEHAKTPFIQDLSSVADVFINDAFAAAHRKQCSLIGFTVTLPSCAGRLMEKEITTLSKIVENPEKPSVFLFGGAKFSDMIITIERLFEHQTADKILLTGLLANAFLKAKGVNLGPANEKALLDEGSEEQFTQIKQLLDKYPDQVYLPSDFAIEEDSQRKEINIDDLPVDKPLFDIGSKTIEGYEKLLSNAKTIFLSGPCGVFENPIFMKGTKELFTYITTLDAFSIVGGGHTVAAVKKLNLDQKMSHISTGGGSLEKFMMGEKLPVIEALKEAKKKYVVTR